MNDKEFLNAVRKYIEKTEVRDDGEWGSCRSLEDLIADKVTPDLYDEVLRRLENCAGGPVD